MFLKIYIDWKTEISMIVTNEGGFEEINVSVTNLNSSRF
jgi:hypothetical protein